MSPQAPEKNKPSYNPGEEHSRQLFNDNSSAPLANQENNAWDGPQGRGPDMKPAERVASDENAPSGAWQNNTTPAGSANTKPTGSRAQRALKSAKAFIKKPKGIMTLVGGGGLGLVIGMVMFLVPNQMKMAVENVMSVVSAVPEYATQQRAEYLTTRFLATRVLALTDDSFDQKMIFCNGGGVACSLTATKYVESFDKKYGLIAKRTVDGVDITVNPQGRSGLGGRAISWKVNYSRAGSFDGKIRTITNSIDTNSEMKKFIKTEVKRTHSKNFLTRYVAKRILMKRYGVTHFRAFEKTRNKISLTTADYRAKLAVNTVGKILPKMPAYLSCLDGRDSLSCQRTLEATSSALNNKVADIEKELENDNLDPDKRRSLEAKRDGYNELNRGLQSPKLEGSLGKMISENLLTKAAGGLAVAGVFDLVFEIVGGVNDGVIEQVSHDIMSQAYIGYAYGDEVGIIPNVDQMTTEGHDMETFGTLTQTLGNMGESPLYQERTGQIDYDPSKVYSAECDTPEGRKLVNLPRGELVCPEEKMVKSYTSFKDDPRWTTLAVFAEIWNNSVGLAFDAIGALIAPVMNTVMGVFGAVFDFITNLPGVSTLKDMTAEKFSQAMEWVINGFFGIPNIVGDDNGTVSYTALDGAITKSINDTMEGGVDTETGEVMGAGGRVLSPLEKLAIENTMLDEERQEFNTKSVLAKIFDADLRGSMVNKLSLVMPSSASGLLGFGPQLLGNINSVLSSNAYAASGSYNAHGFALYGYGPGDTAVFEANPTTYTDEFCQDSAKKREDSYKLRDGDILPSYGEIDPCALERVVVGAMLDEAGITTDQNSLKEPDSEQMNITSGAPADSSQNEPSSSGEVVNGASWPVNKRYWDANQGQFLKAHGTSSGTFTTSGRNGYAIDLGANSVFGGKKGAPVYSMFEGRVSRYLCGTRSSVIIDSNVGGKTLRIAYVHMENGSLSIGQTVSAGQQIGTVGELGCKVNGAHLHMDMSYGGSAVCPQDVFKDMGDNKPLDFDRYTSQIRRGCAVR